MEDMDYVLNFTVNLVREMLISGANLERTDLAAWNVLHAYGLHDISIFSLSSHVRVAGFTDDNRYWSRQVSVPAAGTFLEKLRRLNNLSFRVCREKPAPQKLDGLFREACNIRDYPAWILLAGQEIALFSLAFIMGGVWQDAVCVAIVTFALFFIERGLTRSNMAYIIKDVLGMWVATLLAIALVRAGIGIHINIVIITLCFLLIPGIPLVNAVRNLLCGNEMNGILQLARVILETLALVGGIYLGIRMMGSKIPFSPVTVTLDPVIMVILSFFASVGFGIGFRIQGRNLILAGLGGSITRIVLITLTGMMDNRFVYMILAAFAASLYGEILARIEHVPSTYFIYPAIVPLIPGDLFFYSLQSVMAENMGMFLNYGWECLKALLGMSVGFVISSTVMHYIRRRNIDRMALGLIRPAAMMNQVIGGKVRTVDSLEEEENKEEK